MATDTLRCNHRMGVMTVAMMMVVLTSGFSFAQRHTFFDQCEKDGKLQHKTPMATDQAKTTPAAAKGGRIT